MSTGAVRRTVSSADGSYALVGLPPGTYIVDAGPGTEQTVTLSVASDRFAGPDRNAAPATTTTTTLEGVSVTATTLQEVKTSEVGTIVSPRQIETLPQATRNFLEFADTVPGMVFATDRAGLHQPARRRAAPSRHQRLHRRRRPEELRARQAASTGQDASRGNPFPQLGIGEYKVITSNYKAEYDQMSERGDHGR